MKEKYTGPIMSLLLLCLSVSVMAGVRLPQLLSSGMVLQRNAEITLWGWADADEELAISFDGQTYRPTADDTGEWQVKLPEKKAGGPYVIKTQSLKETLACITDRVDQIRQ